MKDAPYNVGRNTLTGKFSISEILFVISIGQRRWGGRAGSSSRFVCKSEKSRDFEAWWRGFNFRAYDKFLYVIWYYSILFVPRGLLRLQLPSLLYLCVGWGSSAVLWLFISFIPTDDTTAYMYFKNITRYPAYGVPGDILIFFLLTLCAFLSFLRGLLPVRFSSLFWSLLLSRFVLVVCCITVIWFMLKVSTNLS